MEKKTREIRNEIYKTCERLGAKSDLLCVLGSWGDTMEDEEVLQDLRTLNKVYVVKYKSGQHQKVYGRAATKEDAIKLTTELKGLGCEGIEIVDLKESHD